MTEEMTLQCDGCGLMHDSSCQNGHYIDYGWGLMFGDFGYYGGFTDNLEAMFDVRDNPEHAVKYMAHLCHDCCVKFMTTFPLLAVRMGVEGGHPNKNEHDSDNGIATPPCCPFAWTWVRDKDEPDYSRSFTHYRATSDLTWEKVERPAESS